MAIPSRSHPASAAALWPDRPLPELAPRHGGPSAHEQLTRTHPPVTSPWPLPPPTGSAPYRLRLDEVLAKTEAAAIEQRGRLRFHCVGDTGGMRNPGPQQAVVAAMTSQLEDPDPVRFFYHLGDIVYLHGEEENYGAQFLDPYGRYDAPIFAVAGNHDGELGPSKTGPPLAPFARRFCAPAGGAAPDPADGQRAVPQPNLYWTLEHDLVTIVGLYTDVPEGGLIAEEQRRWLTEELSGARRDAALILAMHHPVFSADTSHGSNLALGEVLDECFATAGRAPDAVFSAHAHNYQRFSRSYGGRAIPYVVAGSGGFPELHRMGYGIPDTPASFAGLPGVTLETYQYAAFGFLTITVQPGGARVDYNTVVRRRPVRFDSFSIGCAGVI